MSARKLIPFLMCFSFALAGESGEPEQSKPDPKRLTVVDYFDMESAGDPQISPDGRRIVYVRSWADVRTDKTYSNLWIIDFDGSNHRPLTTGKVNDNAPRWSPSGDRLAYISGSDGSAQLYVMWVDSGQTARISNLMKGPSNPAWSPDGRWIAFNSHVPGKKNSGVKMPPKPEGATWAEPPTVIDRLTYRSDQEGYLPVGYRHVFVIPAEGGTARQITEGDYDHGAAEWARDGSRIYFSAIRKPEAEWVIGDSEVYAANIDDGVITEITAHEGPDEAPVSSPRNGAIAFTGFDEKRQSYTVTKLFVMNSEGGDRKNLSGEFDNDVRSVKWTPDGNSILFLSGALGSTHLYEASPKGSLHQRTEGILQIGNYSVGPNGRIAAVISTPENPGDIYSFTLGRSKPKQLTRLNEDVLGHKELGQIEEIWYNSSFDGRRIQGWIIKPPGFDPAKKYPLVLYIHGGPHAMYGIGFGFDFQALAAKDYVVLYTNPRGSTGYGQEFGNIIQFNYPGDDYFDLVSGVDEVIRRGYVDEDQLYVTGGSGGGVLTCWVVGRTGRFRAAVSQFPVINWYSFIGTADFGYQMGWRWFEKWPWEDPEHYMKRSPIALVGNVTTPLLLITGENDWRTPISETEQYFRALKIQKKKTAMVRVPDEPHGIRARPSHYISKMLHIQEWFEEHNGKEKKDTEEKEE